MTFVFDNTFAREMEGCYVPWKGAPAPEPRLLRLNEALAAELGLDADALRAEGAAVLSGVEPPAGADPLAQAYAGHQFGGFSPQLGDGRALLLGEVIDIHGRRRDIQLKGSGRTPFSRGGDGKAALGPVLREYLVSEAMNALGVPTTRALAAVATGDMVYRETALPGAVLTRVAASHLRVGSFQYLAARGDTERLRKLADYAIARHDPDCAGSANPYLVFLTGVRDRQAALIAAWMGLGFIHGVMNTDNMTISGETIDFGPCAFMDVYAPETVFSSIDAHGRYAYGAQPGIAQWNLARLAEALLPLIDEDQEHAITLCTRALERFPRIYARRWNEVMCAKLGIAAPETEDLSLADGLLAAMQGQGVDYTRLFRALSDAARGDEGPARALFDDPAGFDGWLPGWRARLAREGRAAEDVAAAMDRANPVYIPRNHHVEAALTAAVDKGDMAPFDRLAEALSRPFDQRPGFDDLEGAGPDGQPPYRTFCGT